MVANEKKTPKPLKVNSIPGWDVCPEEIKAKQNEGNSMKKYWQLVGKPVKVRKPPFFLKKRILYRKYSGKINADEKIQLVVQPELRHKVVPSAQHSVSWPQRSIWLSKFFSRIIATHSIPKIWRKAKVIAVEKPEKHPRLAANYHPISLLSVCYKLLEHLALQRISPTVESLLSEDQADVRKSRSTCDQVAALTTFIENRFQQNLKTGAVFLELTAAYDTVWQNGLLYRLSKSMPYWFTRLVSQLHPD